MFKNMKCLCCMWHIDRFQVHLILIVILIGNDKGIGMTRIPSIFTSQGEEVWQFSKER